MDETEFWIRFWKIIGVSFTTTVLGFSGCTMQENYLISEMSSHGVNPIVASCAIHGGKESTACIMTVAKPM